MYRGPNLNLEISRKDKQNIGEYRRKRIALVFGKNGGFAFANDLTEEELLEIFRESRKGKEGKYWLNANNPDAWDTKEKPRKPLEDNAVFVTSFGGGNNDPF